MVQTLTRIGVKQDKVEYVVELLKGMIEPTRQEEGCLNHLHRASVCEKIIRSRITLN